MAHCGAFYIALLATLVSACRPAPVTPCECPDGSSAARSEADPGREESLREVIRLRRSIRRYTDEPLSREDVTAIIWAAQGVTTKATVMENSMAAVAPTGMGRM